MSRSFTDRFNLLKTLSGLSDEELASRLRVARGTIDRWSRGVTEPHEIAHSGIWIILTEARNEAYEAEVKRFNEQFKAASELSGLSDLELARLLHVSIGTIKHWKNGHAPYRLGRGAIFRTLAKQLKCSPDLPANFTARAEMVKALGGSLNLITGEDRALADSFDVSAALEEARALRRSN